MSTDHAVYSHGDLYSNFGNLFRDKLNLQQLDGHKVLILGLGLGSIPELLEQHPPYIWEITAVELDEEVIDLASSYCLPKLKSSIHIVTADAEVYAAICLEKFNLICVDIFLDDQIPQVFLDIGFLQNCNRLLHKTGILIFNTPAYSTAEKEKSEKFFRDHFSKVFTETQLIFSHKNNMLIGRKSSRQLSKS